MGLLSKWIESLDYSLEILPSCTRHRSPRSSCNHCLETCQNEAISLVDGKPIIDRKKCVDCGNCISTCPVQAVAGILPIRNVIEDQLVVSNQQIPTVKELLVSYKKGIRSVFCEDTDVRTKCEELIQEANLVLTQLGEQQFSIAEKAKVQVEVIYTRRELFSFWKSESQSLIKQLTPAKWRFNQIDMDLTRYYPNYQFSQIKLDTETCTLCSACQRLCEQKCLQMSEGRFVISPQSCLSCQLCVDVCPEHAISVVDCISPTFQLEYRTYQKQCKVCHNVFDTLREHDEKCVVCTKREGFLSDEVFS